MQTLKTIVSGCFGLKWLEVNHESLVEDKNRIDQRQENLKKMAGKKFFLTAKRIRCLKFFLFDVVRLLRVSSDHGALLLHRSRDGRAMNRRRALRHRRRRRRVLLLERRPAAVALRAAPASGRRPETLHRLVEAGSALDGAALLLLRAAMVLLLLLDLLLEDRPARVERR